MSRRFEIQWTEAGEDVDSIAARASNEQDRKYSEAENFADADQAWTHCREVFIDDIVSPSEHLGERRLPDSRESG